MNLITRRRQASDCEHQKTIRTENAGLSRVVCATCGQVSLGFVSDHTDGKEPPSNWMG